MKKQRLNDRHWGGIGLTLAVVLLMCASAFATPNPDTTNNANGVSEETATTDEVAAGATSAVVPPAAAPNLGADSATISPSAVPGTRFLMTTAPDDTGGLNEAASLFMQDNPLGYIMQTPAGGRILMKTDPLQPMAANSVVDSVPTAPSLLLTFTSDENPLANMGGANDGGTTHPVGNNADANSFGNADPP